MRHLLITILLLLPTLLFAQEFTFRQEFDTIPVEIEGWEVPAPWTYGMSWSVPSFGLLDVDSDYDLFVGQRQHQLHIFINEGTGNQAYYVWGNQESIPYDSLDSYVYPESCDLNSDGRDDLLLSDDTGVVKFYENLSTPNQILFSFCADSVTGEETVSWLSTVDIDSDNDLDLFTGSYQGRIYFFRNEGTPEQFDFVLITDNFASIDVGYYADPTFCDLDGDDDYDFFIGNSYGVIWYYENIGDSVNYDFTLISNNWLSIDVGDYASPEFCDIDGDGDFDLFVGREPTYTDQHMGDVFFYENVGTSQSPVFEYVTSNYLTLDIGTDARQQLLDIDADGDLDLFSGASDEIRFFENIGTRRNPSFRLEEEYYQDISLESIMPYFCDIDADGDYDLIAGEGLIPGPSVIHLYLNTGTPQAANFVHTSGDLVPGDYDVLARPTLADIDADNDFDMFIFDNDGVLWFSENIGNQVYYNFDTPIPNWQGIGELYMHPQRAQFFDIDEDGDLDLFFNFSTYETMNLNFYRNDGTAQTPNMVFVDSTYLPIEIHYAVPWFCNIDDDDFTDLFVGDNRGGILFFHGINDTSTVNPPLIQHPLHGIEMTFGPNPANPVGVASFQLRVASFVDLGIYDICGRLVKPLASDFLLPGSHQFRWDAEDAASGVYVLRLQAGEVAQAKRVVVLR